LVEKAFKASHQGWSNYQGPSFI